ncbi:hypothetical protein BDW62DRAFT_176631 [Aspergillus aurantiobrunneus]
MGHGLGGSSLAVVSVIASICGSLLDPVSLKVIPMRGCHVENSMVGDDTASDVATVEQHQAGRYRHRAKPIKTQRFHRIE